MKKALIALVILSLLGALCAWLVRRKHAGPPPEEVRAAFVIEKAGAGTLLRYQESQIPLRSFRWAVARTGRWAAAQIITQNDRQEVALFKDGAQVASISVPRPSGVKEGFFHFADLLDFVVVPEDSLVLLYATANHGSDDLPLVVSMDLNTKECRWVHRAAGEHLAVGGNAKESAVFLYGAKDPVVRLPIELQKGEKLSKSGLRSFSKTFEFPPEFREICDLLPTGSWTFLVAHTGGISAYLGSKGWAHQPLQEAHNLFFKDFKPALSSREKRFWWQPWPGTMVQILPDGSPVSTWDPECFKLPEPWEKDAQMLKFLGCDEEASLWFSVIPPELIPQTPPQSTANPSIPQGGQAPSPEAPSKPSDTTTSPAIDPTLLEAWQNHLNQGFDRLYRWNPVQRTLQRFDWPSTWSSLQPPAVITLPRGDGGLKPGTGAFAIEGQRSLWWLPLKSLPLGKPSQTGKASDTPQ